MTVKLQLSNKLIVDDKLATSELTKHEKALSF